MSKVNLNSFISEDTDVVVFNEGNAGRVKNVAVSVAKRLPTDHQQAPDYKIIFTGQNGGTVNLGVYYPTERTSDKEVSIRINQLLNILLSLNPSLKEKALPEFDTNLQAYEFLITQIAKNSKNSLVNIFVNYGIKKKAEAYLSFRAYNIVEPSNTPDETTKLKPNVRGNDYDDVMSRPEATPLDEVTNDKSSSEEDTEW